MLRQRAVERVGAGREVDGQQHRRPGMSGRHGDGAPDLLPVRVLDGERVRILVEVVDVEMDRAGDQRPLVRVHRVERRLESRRPLVDLGAVRERRRARRSARRRRCRRLGRGGARRRQRVRRRDEVLDQVRDGLAGPLRPLDVGRPEAGAPVQPVDHRLRQRRDLRRRRRGGGGRGGATRVAAGVVTSRRREPPGRRELRLVRVCRLVPAPEQLPPRRARHRAPRFARRRGGFSIRSVLPVRVRRTNDAPRVSPRCRPRSCGSRGRRSCRRRRS
jgi:hypothetical protein